MTVAFKIFTFLKPHIFAALRASSRVANVLIASLQYHFPRIKESVATTHVLNVLEITIFCPPKSIEITHYLLVNAPPAGSNRFSGQSGQLPEKKVSSSTSW